MHDIERLLKGFKRFQQRYFDAEPALFDDLRRGQHPGTLLIGCSDSRVDPGLLLGCRPGDLFTVRNVANLVPRCDADPCGAGSVHGVSAAIQFAVEQLKVARIIVMGHAGCGGIRALMACPCEDESRPAHVGPDEQTDFIGPWMHIAMAARNEVERSLPDADPAQRQRACEQAAVLISLRNLQTFPFVRHAMENGLLTLHGWYFDLEAGALLAYSERADDFLPMVCSIQSASAA